MAITYILYAAQDDSSSLGAALANQKVSCTSAKARNAASELLDIGVWVVFIITMEEEEEGILTKSQVSHRIIHTWKQR